MLLPPELWDYVLTFVPADDLQRTSLSLTRAIPSAKVSTSLLWRNLRLTREGQAWQAIHKLRSLDQGVKGAVKTVKATAFREDPQQLVNLLLSLPSAENLHLNIGPLFSPAQLDELLLPSSALSSRRFHKLSSLSFRFNPYCMERSYFVFLKGTYFDSVVHNLASFSLETAPRLRHLKFVQDLSPNHGSKKKKETPAFGLHELRNELDAVEAEMDMRIDASRQPPASGKFARKNLEANGKMDFAQPIVFFRLDCLATLSVSPVGRYLTSLTLRLPRRNVLPALTLQSSPSNPPCPSLVHLDLSTTHILDDARLPTLLRLYPSLESLVIDRCTGLISEEAVEENTAIQTLRWLGKISAGIGLTRSEEVSRNWKRIVKERPTDAPNLPRSARQSRTTNSKAASSTPALETSQVDSLVPPVKELFIIPPPPRLSSLGCGLHELPRASTTRLWSKSFAKGYTEAIEKSCDKIEEYLERWELWNRTGKLKDGTRRLCTFKDALTASEFKRLHLSSGQEEEEAEDPDPLFEKFCQSRQLVSIDPATALDLLELNRRKSESFKVCFVPDCGNLAGIPRLSLNSNGKEGLEERELRENGIEEIERRELERMRELGGHTEGCAHVRGREIEK
ncbi:uncharacterized protein JCM6883_007656 [Sporobolomyces salmoneus]|uniref:uncharacterized protein n=1 Tax=Sporobolomyces salmoneus TaxID=183962 RepID=UPI00317D87DA